MELGAIRMTATQAAQMRPNRAAAGLYLTQPKPTPCHLRCI